MCGREGGAVIFLLWGHTDTPLCIPSKPWKEQMFFLAISLMLKRLFLDAPSAKKNPVEDKYSLRLFFSSFFFPEWEICVCYPPPAVRTAWESPAILFSGGLNSLSFQSLQMEPHHSQYIWRWGTALCPPGFEYQCLVLPDCLWGLCFRCELDLEECLTSCRALGKLCARSGWTIRAP